MSLQSRRDGVRPKKKAVAVARLKKEKPPVPKNEFGKAKVHGAAYGIVDKIEIDKKLDEMLAVLLKFQRGIKNAKLEETLHEKVLILGKLAEAMKYVDELAVQAYELSGRRCCYCGDPAQGNFSINRDGFDRGPLLDLCDRCGSGAMPTMETIWESLRNKTKISPVDDMFMHRLNYSMKIIDDLLKGLGQ
jgi:hypothetical protein